MNVDPIQLEIMRGLFEAAAGEMGTTLRRTAFSANIKERQDYSCALFDSDAQLIAQAAHIPVHLGSMPASVRACIDRLGALTDGDVAIVNDPFCGGTHLPDITLVSPVFADNRLVGYVANRAHHADVGGVTPGSMTLSRHIDEEGVRIEPSYMYRAGRKQDEALDRLLAAVRTPQERLGDLQAQLAANHVGAEALSRMVRDHGVEVVAGYGRALLDYSQAFMSRLLHSIPAQSHAFEDVLDDDGAGTSRIPIRVKLKIENGKAVVDLRDSADQVAGCVNCPSAVTQSAVYYCFLCLLDEIVPTNAGCFRDVDVLTRPGSVLDAQYPAAVVAGNTETSQRVVDVVFGALAKALPGRIPAASCGTMNSVALGTDQWTYYETIGGGTGAGPGFDGADAVQCHMTNTLNTPAEALELQYPLRVIRFERARGTGGAGRFHGGEGIIRELQATQNCEGTLLTDRRESEPYGQAGGDPGSRGRNTILRADGTVEGLAGKAKFMLFKGDTLQIRTPGGGGFGEF